MGCYSKGVIGFPTHKHSVSPHIAPNMDIELPIVQYIEHAFLNESQQWVHLLLSELSKLSSVVAALLIDLAVSS